MELTMAQIFNLLKYASTVKEVLDAATSNTDIVSKLKSAAGPIFKILQAIGANVFPDAKQDMQTIGAAIAGFDSTVVKWVQEGCNAVLDLGITKKLAVDGIYGPLTRDAVKQVQQKFGLNVDGVAGRLTQAAIDNWFAQQKG